MNDVSVSVYITTYNNAKYLRQAIDSVLMQKCIFKYEIVVGDDCSEDETRSILLEYEEQHAHKFTLLFHDEKLGLMSNFIKTWEACSGKYIALLDANDYWQDAYKLQKQVDFLESNENYVTCYHDCMVVDEKSTISSESFGRTSNYSKDQQICGMATMQFSTRVLRNIDISLPDYMMQLEQPDTIIGHFSGFYGEAYFLNEIEKSVYRLLQYDVSDDTDIFKNLKRNIATREMIVRSLGEDERRIKIVRRYIETIYLDTLYVTLRDKGFSSYLHFWKEINSDKNVSAFKMSILHITDTIKKIMHKISKHH